uniref:Uncharacterized protein n=1 Tax=viral metagenome TaxID=1070528 RepID=A0A6C0JY15_9ZZZZ
MANTTIQLKYSSATATPTTLNVGEAAYSFTSDKFFIGNTTNHVLTIGGKYYTTLVDAATDANTASAIVKRDTVGMFSATAVKADLFGNANTATKWQTARNIGVSGDANGIVSVDGSANANIPLTLGNSGVAAGWYGDSTTIPVYQVDSKGRITAAANVGLTAGSSTVQIAGDTGADSVALATDTITFVGGDGITTAVYSANSNVRFDVDGTVIRTTGTNQTIDGSLAITGNLVVSGNTITHDVDNIKTDDSLIQLAANNAADILDIGIFGTYVNAGTKYTAFFRDASDSGKFKLMTGGTELPSAVSNTVNAAAFSRATLDANFTGGTVSGLSSVIAIADGGTNASSFTTGNLVHFNGTSLVSLANSTYTLTGGLANSNTITSITVDGFGRVTAATGATINISATQIGSGTLTVTRGGTGVGSFTANGVVIAGLTSTAALSSVASSTEGHVLQINTSGIPTFAHLQGGTF